MKALWITLAAIGGLILLLILLLVLGKAKIRITCIKKPRVVLYVFGIPFTLISDKEKKEKAASKDLSRCRNPERALKKELKRQRKEAQKAEKKKQKAAKKAARKKAKKQQKKAIAKTQPQPNIKENLEMVTALVKTAHRVTHGKIGVHVKKMHLSVATGDAAQTAILYGVIVQSASYLLHWIEAHFTKFQRDPGAVQIRADYLSAKSHTEIDILLSVRISQALGIALKMLNAYQNEKAKAMQKARARQNQNL